MSQGHQLGRWGENLARSFLEMAGFTCLAQRFRRQCGELDLVMTRGGLVIFVEVKTRGPGRPDRPEAWVDRRKLARMRRTARHWLQENHRSDQLEFRFDVVAVEFNGLGRGVVLRHLPGVG